MNTRRDVLSKLGALPLALAAQRAPAFAQGSAPTPIVVNVTTPVDVVPLFYGVQQKMFAKAGLDLSYQIVPSGAIAMVAVVGGAANVGFANPLSVITAHAKGIPLVLIAPGGEYLTAAPNAQIFVASDSAIRTPKDLEDRSCAITGLHDLMAIAVRSWADSGGADSSKIRFVEMPPSTMLAALQSKRVDAIGAFEPFRSEAIAAGARPIGAPYDAIGREFLTGAWFGNGTWLEAHHDAGIRFAQVIRESGAYANAHYDELIPLMSSYSKIPVESQSLSAVAHPRLDSGAHRCRRAVPRNHRNVPRTGHHPARDAVSTRMKFGLFDHIDRSDRPLAQQYDERFEFIAAAEAAGFYAYHLAEHHATPISTVPVPSIFLAAVAQMTTRLRLGPMVYLLPLNSPLRVIEEICILDHLSHGRLDIGIGRGTSPFEFAFNHVDFGQSQTIFADAYNCLVEGLTHERLTYAGPHFTYGDVPMALEPLQRPHPPFWYGSSSERSSAWAGEQGLQFLTSATGDVARANFAAFSNGLARRGGPAVPSPAFPGGSIKGVMREVVVAETEAEARRIAKPAHDHLYANQTYLRREHENGAWGDSGIKPTPPARAGDFDDAIREGSTIVGTPETVRAQIARQIDDLGINYFVGYFMFGTMTLADALRSLQLFTSDVMPHFETVLQRP